MTKTALDFSDSEMPDSNKQRVISEVQVRIIVAKYEFYEYFRSKIWHLISQIIMR